MNSQLSNPFQRLYCDPTVFTAFSSFHPISFARVLPFQPQDPVADDHQLISTEEAHLAERTDDTRRRVIEAYSRCGLLPEADAANLISVIDYFEADFFDLMGLVYANAGMFRCALRWHRESIKELETQNPNFCLENESVFASVGYCLYSLGLFEEAILWSKACLGPRQTADTVCRALIAYEAQVAGGALRSTEKSGPRIKYTVATFDAANVSHTVPRLKAAMNAFAPFLDFYMDWTTLESPIPEPWPEGYPFQAEFDGSNLQRHKMNLIFATCNHADALIKKGYIQEAKRLLWEAAMVEPEAPCIQDRIKLLP